MGESRFVTPPPPAAPLPFSPWLRLAHDYPVDQSARRFARPCLGDHALHYFHEGRGSYLLRNERFDIRPGTVFLVRPGEAYEFTLDPGARVTMYNLHFDLTENELSYRPFPVAPEDWQYKERLPESLPPFQQLADRPEYEQTFQRLLAAAARLGTHAELERKSLLLELFAILYRNLSLAPGHADRTMHRRKVETAIDELGRNLSRNVPIAELAEKLEISRALLCRIFREATGVGIQRYFAGMKFRAAQLELQSTRLPIKEIAAKYGFPDGHHFTRRYRQITGTTPGEIRRK
mgnify:CR=1 FL=1